MKCPKCGAPAASVPAGARIVITKAPDTQVAGFGRTMMDMGPSGSPTQVIFSLGKSETVIGRVAECDVPLNHSTVSKQHAKVVWDAGAFWIEDMGSVNGTRVNDVDISQRRQLAANDQIKIGKYLLTFLPPSGP